MLAEKILIDTNKKIVSTDDGLKNHQLVLSKITVGEIDQKIAPTGVSQKNIDAQSVSFRDTPEIKWKHRCIIK